MFFAGIFLMLKKELNWIQPPTQRGAITAQMPDITYPQLLAAAQSRPEAGIAEWTDIDKIDMRPYKGVAKLISKTGWEVQVDTSNAQVLSVNYRRSDIIESIHDGSYFAGWTKLFLFLPVGILLLIMWATGIYLFIITEWQKIKKRRRLKTKNITKDSV